MDFSVPDERKPTLGQEKVENGKISTAGKWCLGKSRYGNSTALKNNNMQCSVECNKVYAGQTMFLPWPWDSQPTWCPFRRPVLSLQCENSSNTSSVLWTLICHNYGHALLTSITIRIFSVLRANNIFTLHVVTCHKLYFTMYHLWYSGHVLSVNSYSYTYHQYS